MFLLIYQIYLKSFILTEIYDKIYFFTSYSFVSNYDFLLYYLILLMEEFILLYSLTNIYYNRNLKTFPKSHFNYLLFFNHNQIQYHLYHHHLYSKIIYQYLLEFKYFFLVYQLVWSFLPMDVPLFILYLPKIQAFFLDP